MNSTLKRILVAAAAVASFATAPAHAHWVDTGTPNGNDIGALAFDATDYYAGRVSFAGTTRIDSIFGHILGGTAGETFTIALYDDSPSHVPGTALYQTSATFGVDGWNGANGLAGWLLSAGTYWVAFEIGFGDTLGSGSITGALLDVGAPNPLAATAFDAGGGYVASARPLSFGLQLDATAINEPASIALVLVGLSLAVNLRRRRS